MLGDLVARPIDRPAIRSMMIIATLWEGRSLQFMHLLREVVPRGYPASRLGIAAVGCPAVKIGSNRVGSILRAGEHTASFTTYFTLRSYFGTDSGVRCFRQWSLRPPLGADSPCLLNNHVGFQGCSVRQLSFQNSLSVTSTADSSLHPPPRAL